MTPPASDPPAKEMPGSPQKIPALHARRYANRFPKKESCEIGTARRVLLGSSSFTVWLAREIGRLSERLLGLAPNYFLELRQIPRGLSVRTLYLSRWRRIALMPRVLLRDIYKRTRRNISGLAASFIGIPSE